MAKKLVPFAICYDFDGTLAPGNMQERDFIPQIGMKSKAFWQEVHSLSQQHEADNILMYMKLMLDKANAAEIQVRRENFEKYGRGLDFFPGVEAVSANDNPVAGWFERINAYGAESGVRVEHYVISSGIREMVEGTRIKKFFKKVYASSYWYDHHGVAKWPALALNYTTKTHYLFRINKGTLQVSDHSIINNYVPDVERPVPFSNMVFIGDGETDIPCFRTVKDLGGHSIAVFAPGKKGAKSKAEELLQQGRVNFAAQADYSQGARLDRVVKALIDKISADHHLAKLGT